MARVVADAVVVRQEPRRDAPQVLEICMGEMISCEYIRFGTRSGMDSVYLLDGPVRADGFDWYLAVQDGGVFPEYAGWIAAGDADDPWLVPAQPDCPAEPIELEDVTLSKISQLELLACVGGTELTLRGWYPAVPDDEPRSATCEPMPEREAFCGFGWDLLRPIEAPIFGNADNFPWVADSTAGLTNPGADRWITIRGRLDHPAATTCYDRSPHSVLLCRLDFVVSSISEG